MLTFSPATAPLPAPRTPYEAQALGFCRDWLNGLGTYSLQTSGSTGVPKTLTLTRAQMQASAHLTGQALRLNPNDHALVCLNVAYVAGLMMLVRGMELGLRLTLVEPSAHPLLPFYGTTPAFDFAAFVPLQLQTMLETPTQTLPLLNRMKAILVGGAATDAALDTQLQRISAPVWATYGMTETVSHVALRRLNGPGRAEVFTALPGVALGTDARGCLSICSAATNFQTVQTNDLVALQTPTTFRLLGRVDNVINSGGVKVPAEAVEAILHRVLTQTGWRGRLLVAGLPDARLGLAVQVVADTPAPDAYTWQQARQQVAETLGPYAVPKNWLTVPTFAETPTGKIDRQKTLNQLIPK